MASFQHHSINGSAVLRAAFSMCVLYKDMVYRVKTATMSHCICFAKDSFSHALQSQNQYTTTVRIHKKRRLYKRKKKKKRLYPRAQAPVKSHALLEAVLRSPGRQNHFDYFLIKYNNLRFVGTVTLARRKTTCALSYTQRCPCGAPSLIKALAMKIMTSFPTDKSSLPPWRP